MSPFLLYQSLNDIDDSLLERCEETAKTSRVLPLKRWGALAACFCLVAAAVMMMPKGEQTPAPSDAITPGSRPAVPALDQGQEDSSKKDPAVRKELTLAEALEMEPFGRYLLREGPAGFAVESVSWYQGEDTQTLSGLWSRGTGSFDELRWRVRSYDPAGDEERLAPLDQPERYDLGRYPIPWADSVPEELFRVVDHPIFLGEELTREAVESRAYTPDDAGDSSGTRMNFGVLYGDILVEITAKGVSPQWLYEQLAELGK